MTQLSVIVPALNAAATLPGCLASLQAARRRGLADQLLVVDGGSRDSTREIAERSGAVLVETQPGRGRQLAEGARLAAGEWLLFLHADTRLEEGWEAAVEAFLASGERDTAAVFRLAFDEDSPGARRVAAAANWRTRRLGLPYGDQGLLIARDFYQRLGGYPEQPLMEDVALARRIGRRRLRVLPASAITSSGRYRRGGWWARPARNIAVLTLYFLGLPPRVLKRIYG